MEVNGVKEGIVKWYNPRKGDDHKGMGFILVEGQDDVHVSGKNLGGLMLYEGDKVSFDETPGERPGTFTATNVKVLVRAPKGERDGKGSKPSLTAAWAFSEPRKTATGFLTFLVITFKKGNRPVAGLIVKSFKVDWQQLLAEPYSTDENGTVSFPVEFVSDTDQRFLEVTVGTDSEQATFSYVWSKPEPTSKPSDVKDWVYGSSRLLNNRLTFMLASDASIVCESEVDLKNVTSNVSLGHGTKFSLELKGEAAVQIAIENVPEDLNSIQVIRKGTNQKQRLAIRR